jgi:hypothetical protein
MGPSKFKLLFFFFFFLFIYFFSDYTPITLAEDVYYTFSSVVGKEARPILVGHSLGATVATAYAHLHPTKVCFKNLKIKLLKNYCYKIMNSIIRFFCRTLLISN